MDDLLALMDGADNDGNDPVINSDSRETSFDEPEKFDRISTLEIQSRNKSVGSGSSDWRVSNNHISGSNTSPDNGAETVVDSKIGIRISKRLISSIELLDWISSNPYHSTAALSAMSHAALNQILVEPATVLSDATICGKTNIAMVGIIFANTGTRISSNGRAYAVLSIGNLNTGPVVSVFLFGNAYSRLCTKCPPGTVVAIITPTLIPPRADGNSTSGETTIAFSVNDERQLLRVGNARDYGTCQAAVGRKGADGKWIANSGKCKKHIDKRAGPFCAAHRNNVEKKNGFKGGKNGSAMDRLRTDHREAQNLGTVRGGFSGKTQSQMMHMLTPSGPVVTHVPQGGTKSTRGGLVGSKASGTNLRAPMHLKKQTSRVTVPCASRQPLNLGSQRRVASDTGSLHSKTTRSPLKSLKNNTRKQDWLVGTKRKTKKNPSGTAVSPQKRRNINVDTAEYNGSVLVPRQSKLFASSGSTATLVSREKETTLPSSATSNTSAEAIRNKQKTVARYILEKKQLPNKKPNPYRESTSGPCRPTRTNESVGTGSLKDSLFGKLDKGAAEAIIATQSRFASEADAESYAMSRKAVLELERREEQKEMKTPKREGINIDKKESGIQKEWICETCERTTTKPRKSCQRLNHKVRLNRTVKETKTAANMRLQLHNKDAADGGLTLGRGIEWST